MEEGGGRGRRRREVEKKREIESEEMKKKKMIFFFSPPVVSESDRVGEQLGPVRRQAQALDRLVLDDLDDLRHGADAGAEEDAVALFSRFSEFFLIFFRFRQKRSKVEHRFSFSPSLFSLRNSRNENELLLPLTMIVARSWVRVWPATGPATAAAAAAEVETVLALVLRGAAGAADAL